MTQGADKKKSKSSCKYISNKYMPRVDLEKKTQQLQRDIQFVTSTEEKK